MAEPKNRFENGSILSGKVTAVSSQEAELDLGDGAVGVLNCRHYTSGLMIDLADELKEGDEVEAAVLIREDHLKRVVLSRIWARTQRAWQKILEAHKSGEVIEVRVAHVIKGGLAVFVDEVRGFVPASLLMLEEFSGEDGEGEVAAEAAGVVDAEVAPEPEPESAPGPEAAPGPDPEPEPEPVAEAESESDDELEADAAPEPETDDESEADAALEPEAAESVADAEAESAPEPAAETVSEPAADAVPEPTPAAPATADILDSLVGQTISCKVIEASQSKGRLILSHNAAVWAGRREALKQTLQDFSKGNLVEGTVVALEEFGAFVEVDGVRGLLHRREMAWNHGPDPDKLFSVGDQVSCQITKLNPDKAQLLLSLKAGENPIEQLEAGQVLVGRVDRLTYSGAIVELDTNGAGGGAAGADEVGEGAGRSAGGDASADVDDSAADDGTANNGSAQTSHKCQLFGFLPVSEMAENPPKQPQRLVVPGDEVTVKIMDLDKRKARVDLSIIEAIIPEELLAAS